MFFDGFWYAPWAWLPLIAANMLPVLVGRGGRPLDSFGWWPKRWPTGGGKTLRGLILGCVLGVYLVRAIAIVLALWCHNPKLVDIWYFNQFRSWKIMFAMALGALLGDLIESIIKRRRGIPRGAAWWPYDQLDAIVGGFGLTALVDWPWFKQHMTVHIGIWIVIYLLVHPLFSRGAYLFKLKTAPH